MNQYEQPQPKVPTPAPPPARPATSRWRRAIAWVTIAYCLSLVLLLIWMRREGDRSWLATLFLFGPRWICAAPLLLLVPLAAIWYRRLLWLLLLSGVLIVSPIMGFESHFSDENAPMVLRVLTCNVAQSKYHVASLANLIEETRPDIVALQEVKQPPPELVWPKGWHVLFTDELLVASRHPIVEDGSVPRETVPGKLVGVRYLIELPQRKVQFFNLHLITPRDGLEAVLDSKRGLDLSGIPRLDAILQVRTEESWLTSAWVGGF